MPRDAIVLKIQRELCHPKYARKVLGLSRNRPQACKYKRPVNRHLRINPWIAGRPVRSFTDSFRESLFLNYLIITRDNIYVSERKNNKFNTRQITRREIPGNRKFPRCHQVLSRPQIIVFFSVPNISSGFNLWLDSVIDSKSV